jgi:hypothetical protein
MPRKPKVQRYQIRNFHNAAAAAIPSAPMKAALIPDRSLVAAPVWRPAFPARVFVGVERPVAVASPSAGTTVIEVIVVTAPPGSVVL